MKTVTLTSKQLEILSLALEELSENEHINEGLNDDGTPIDPEDSDNNFPLTTTEMENLNEALFSDEPVQFTPSENELLMVNQVILEKLGYDDGETFEYTRDELEIFQANLNTFLNHIGKRV